jgi:hypothetical protein
MDGARFLCQRYVGKSGVGRSESGDPSDERREPIG